MSDQKSKEKRRIMYNDIITGSKGKQQSGSKKRAPIRASTSELIKKQRTSSFDDVIEETGNNYNKILIFSKYYADIQR